MDGQSVIKEVTAKIIRSGDVLQLEEAQIVQFVNDGVDSLRRLLAPFFTIIGDAAVCIKDPGIVEPGETATLGEDDDGSFGKVYRFRYRTAVVCGGFFLGRSGLGVGGGCGRGRFGRFR